MRILPFACAALVGASAITGCSSNSSSSSTGSTTPVTAEKLAAHSAVISIADPAGTDPSVTVIVNTDDVSDALIALAAELDTDNVCGVLGSYSLRLSGTNNAERDITNFKAVVNSANSILGAATITEGTGAVDTNSNTPSHGERFVYFGEALTTPAGATRDAADDGDSNDDDDFCVNPNATTQDPLIITVDLPTEDVGIITTSSYSGEDEIYAIDTGVGYDRVVGSTSAYFFQDVDQSTSDAANATEGFMSADGRYAYLGHKTNPYVLILDTYTGAVDAMALLDPPETPYPSGQAARIASVSALTPSPDGSHFYAAVLDGGHPYDDGDSSCANDDAEGVIAKSWIIKVRMSDMSVVGELDVSAPGSRTCGDFDVLKRIAFSDDGSVGSAALKNSGRVIIFNPNAMTLTKSLIVNDANNDRIDPRYVALNDDGSKIYVAYDDTNNNELDIIDTSDYSVSQLEIQADIGSSDAGDLRFGPDGRLYYMRRDSTEPLVIFDLSTDPVTETVLDSSFLPGSTYPYGKVTFSPYGDYYYLADSGEFYKIRLSDDTVDTEGTIDPQISQYHLSLPTRQ